MIDARTRDVERISLPNGVEPESLAVLPGGKSIIYTALDPTTRNTGLFRWDRNANEAPVSIGEADGFHGDVTLSQDGQWIYFTHNRGVTAGPPGQHGMKNYAQLFRVRADGSRLEQLTQAAGCHFGPILPKVGSLFYIHTSCHGMSWLKRMGSSEKSSTTLLQEMGRLLEPASAPDGQSLLLASENVDFKEIKELDVRSNKITSLFQFRRDSPTARAQYGANRQDVFFQNKGWVWLWSQGQSTQLAPLRVSSHEQE
ncbi:TolB family protein [Corallococcus exiguus]|uniref:TolB family protein n=1 Tax=Corallococcus exiguus TaxID=83462 RepID=UPI00147146C7|nr:PD40 domain-containing protein [Corallococcus exiguus]NNB89727.1 hypothetical protein [Corallococcus exiguus]